MQNPMVKEAVKRESIFTQDEIRRRAYFLKEKFARDRQAEMDYAIEKGLKQGLEQGRKEIQNLLLCLIKDGKADEIPLVLADENLLKELLAKYPINPNTQD